MKWQQVVHPLLSTKVQKKEEDKSHVCTASSLATTMLEHVNKRKRMKVE